MKKFQYHWLNACHLNIKIKGARIDDTNGKISFKNQSGCTNPFSPEFVTLKQWLFSIFFSSYSHCLNRDIKCSIPTAHCTSSRTYNTYSYVGTFRYNLNADLWTRSRIISLIFRAHKKNLKSECVADSFVREWIFFFLVWWVYWFDFTIRNGISLIV